MAHTDPHASADARSASLRRARWPLTGLAAGITGAIATLVADLHVSDSADTATVLQVNRPAAHLGVVTGYLTVALLLVLAAQWRHRVEARVPASTAARTVSAGLIAAAGALMLGYGWKGALAIYLPGGSDSTLFDQSGLYVYYVLNDFGSFIGWTGVAVSAGAITWMALRERTIQRWIGLLSLLPVLAVTMTVLLTGLPGFAGLICPAWMIITFLGLTFGNSTITR
ncbi:hypothetical protein [Planobispora rosea]|uniref:hypothetical protein n=1 Tax=Planobispora rosea TaxID=35762 RepID=UPI00083A2E4D|nr:hypothetical protein [Planobispora rosea]